MRRLGTRLGILETELRYAWRALDLLSQEYVRMWDRLEKLELILSEQQGVISQLIDFYTVGGERRPGLPAAPSLELSLWPELVRPEETNHPDEAFYRSLNNAYRNDLVSSVPSSSSPGNSQLGMIWEEPEDDSNGNCKGEDVDIVGAEVDRVPVFGTSGYKDYDSSISDRKVADLSDLSSMDQATIRKLKELDMLTSKLKKDSRNLKVLQNRLLQDSPRHNNYLLEEQHLSEITITEEETSIIEDQIRRAYNESTVETWNSPSSSQNELFASCSRLEAAESLSSLSSSRKQTDINVIDEVSFNNSSAGPNISSQLVRTPSPRRKLDNSSDIYGSSSYIVSTSSRELSRTNISLPPSPKFKDSVEAAQYSKPSECGSSPLGTVALETSNSRRRSPFEITEEIMSPSPSISSLRIRPEGYVESTNDLNLDLVETQPYITMPSSPPPPAPQTNTNPFLMPSTEVVVDVSASRISPVNLFSSEVSATASNLGSEHLHGLSPRTPHSPKSPRTSPKHIAKSNAKLVSAKSDSGLSSMSGWSSLEKSPGSPKSGSNSRNTHHHSHSSRSYALTTQQQPHEGPSELTTYRYNEGTVSYSSILNEAYSSVQLPLITSNEPLQVEDEPGNCVPPPAPEVTTPKRSKPRNYDYITSLNSNQGLYDYSMLNDPPSIYSVAGSHRQQSYTSVYTSGSSHFAPCTTPSRYPDLLDKHSVNETTGKNMSHRAPSYTYEQRSYSTSSYSGSLQGGKRNLQRVHSTGSVPSHHSYNIPPEDMSNFEGYKTAMYRTMFPTGNITDALSYYPSNIGFADSDQMMNNPNYRRTWTPEIPYSHNVPQRMPDAHDVGWSRTLLHEKHVHRKPGRSEYLYRQSSSPWPSSSESYLHSEHFRSYDDSSNGFQSHESQMYDPSSIIVSKSGYISISSNIKERKEEKPRKSKRTTVLKHAMSSVSHWLPDIHLPHLPKRYRSNSLPTGVRREDLMMSNESRQMISDRNKAGNLKKKKKHILVSTMSGILQKAKRRAHNLTHSMSDPEQSETEWSGRQSAVSEDSEDSVFSDAPQDSMSVFQKVALPTSSIQECSPDMDVTSTVPNMSSEIELLEQSLKERSQTPEELPAPQAVPAIQNENTNVEERPLDSCSLFATIGEVRKINEDLKEDVPIPPVTIGTASREFAVSRALGKYRRRQSSSISEEETPPKQEEISTVNCHAEESEISKPSAEPDKIIIINENIPDEIPQVINNRISMNVVQTNSNSHHQEGLPVSESAPNISLVKQNSGRHFLPRHQQSLEIPWGGRGSGDTDDDNRSTHSFRSTSRVSSRRQSTEDSIDTEDEWYCYELKKLEEMERTGFEIPELPLDIDQNVEINECVKVNMGHVLEELRQKVIPKESIDEVIGQKKEQKEEEPIPEPTVEKEPKKRKTSGDSSGDTSGPDSPHQSLDDLAVDEETVEQELEVMRRSSAADDVPPEEPILIPSNDQEYPGTPTLPRLSFQDIVRKPAPAVASPPAESAPSQDTSASIEAEMAAAALAGKNAGPLAGAKWKLLKALKERKAEEAACQEAASKEATTTATVSYLVFDFFKIYSTLFYIYIRSIILN